MINILKIEKSKIVESHILEDMVEKFKNKFSHKENEFSQLQTQEEIMAEQEKYGIESLTKVVNTLGDLVETGFKAFKDGAQLSDVRYIPEATGELWKIAGAFPHAIKEIQDLSLEEGGKIAGVLGERLLKLFIEFGMKI